MLSTVEEVVTKSEGGFSQDESNWTDNLFILYFIDGVQCKRCTKVLSRNLLKICNCFLCCHVNVHPELKEKNQMDWNNKKLQQTACESLPANLLRNLIANCLSAWKPWGKKKINEWLNGSGIKAILPTLTKANWVQVDTKCLLIFMIAESPSCDWSRKAVINYASWCRTCLGKCRYPFPLL